MGPPPPPPPPPSPCQVRCARCHEILTVAPGITEFSCPKCHLPQMLPPELLPNKPSPGPTTTPTPTPATAKRPPPPPPPQLPATSTPQLPSLPALPPPPQGVDPTKIQLPCARCKAILNVPHGLARFKCPQCGVDLAVDLSKVQQFFGPGPASSGSVPPLHEQPEEINEVAIDVEREEDEGGPVGETFMDYRPPKLSLGHPHPDPVVETSSLSAVQPPEPTYNLKIMDELENTKALSCLQIETIVYACQRHLHHLQNGARAGFFIGDGAGVGKGRTIAGLIWENWHHRRRKAVWVSVGSDLKFDARRDLDDVGATCVEVHALNKLPYSKLDSRAVGIKEGVVFLTYSSLIASSEKGRSRLQQLLQWCGSEFDGLVVFDECHKAKNLIPEAGSQPTRTGEAVLELQARLPEARVVYCSATGFLRATKLCSNFDTFIKLSVLHCYDYQLKQFELTRNSCNLNLFIKMVGPSRSYTTFHEQTLAAAICLRMYFLPSCQDLHAKKNQRRDCEPQRSLRRLQPSQMRHMPNICLGA